MLVDKMTLEKSVDCLADKLCHSQSWYTNCAGYAFGIDGWYVPYSTTDDLWLLYYNADRNNSWEVLEQYFVSNILKDFPEWRIHEGEISEGKQYVAFRIRKSSFWCDFHFMKFDRTVWTQKCGHSPIEKGEWLKLIDIYEPEAWDVYDGNLILLEKKL